MFDVEQCGCLICIATASSPIGVPVKLAIFDLDNTLIGGDSDYLWGRFLEENNYAFHTPAQRKKHDSYYDDYQQGKLDIGDFLAFQLQPLAENQHDILHAWRMRYLEEKIKPIILPKAKALVEKHRVQGHQLLIITATNSFLTQPIAELFGIDSLIATEPELRNGSYTGRVSGIPSYAEGKVVRYQAWLAEHQYQPEQTWFYSDSHNDLPLLERVTHPVAVDPDAILQAQAKQRGWLVISLR